MLSSSVQLDPRLSDLNFPCTSLTAQDVDIRADCNGA